MRNIFENRPQGATTPPHWHSIPLKYLFRRSKSLGSGQERLLSIYRDYGVIPKDSRDDNFNKASDDLSQYQIVFQGDLVVNKMKAWQGSVAVSEYDGIISPAYFVYRPIGAIDNRFAHYLLRSNEYFHYYASISSGVRPNQWDLDPRAFERLEVAFPPPQEQRLIADFLDREIAEIDGFLEELNKLPALTMEHLRSEAAELLAPPSASASCWTRAHLGPLISITAGLVDPQKHPYSSMPLIAPNHIESRTSRLLGLETAAEQGAESGKYFAKEGQILFSKIRPTLMKSTLAPADCLTSADMYPINANPRFLTNEFLLEYLLGPQFEDFAARESSRVAMPKLNRETLSKAPIDLPPLEHQHLVVKTMQEARFYAREHLTEIETAIRLGQERRSSLISAAVTGQIDVTTQGIPASEQLRDELEVHV